MSGYQLGKASLAKLQGVHPNLVNQRFFVYIRFFWGAGR